MFSGVVCVCFVSALACSMKVASFTTIISVGLYAEKVIEFEMLKPFVLFRHADVHTRSRTSDYVSFCIFGKSKGGNRSNYMMLRSA